MKILTKNTDYAIQALIFLAKEKESFVSAKKISEKLSIPYHFLRGILQKLIQCGLVESREGALGGVQLIKSPLKIRIIDLIKIFQGNFELFDCMFRQKICTNRKTCVLRKEIKRIENMVGKEFEELTIGKLLRKLKK